MKREHTRVGADEVKRFLVSHPGWAVDADGQLARTIEFPSFLEGIAWVQKIAAVAEQADHHPDLDIRWRKITVRLFTHDAKSLTTRDLELATQADALAKA